MNNSKFYFALLALGASLGIGNVFLYSQYSVSYSGLFFIPYLIALVVLGFPLLLLEFAIGQRFKKNVIDIFASIRKWFSTIGWLMVINSFILMCMMGVFLAWNIIYMLVSFGQQWKDYPESYFFNNVLQVSEGFQAFFEISMPVLVGLVLGWVIVFFLIRKGMSGIRKVFLVLLPLFAVLMLFFMFYTLSLDNALKGIDKFFDVGDGIFSYRIWFAAFSLAAASLGISFGVMSTLAKNSEKGFLVRGPSTIIIMEIIVSIAMGFIVFSILGFLGSQRVDVIGISEPDFAYTMLSYALPLFYGPTILSILFYLMLLVLGLLGVSALAYFISSIVSAKFNIKEKNAFMLVCLLGLAGGLLFAIKPGFFLIDIVSHFIFYNILIVLLLEAIAIGWFFDTEKISYFINHNSPVKIGKIWEFFIKYIVPVVLVGMIFYRLRMDYYIGYNTYPVWAVVGYGVGVVVIPLVIAFLLPHKIRDKRRFFNLKNQ